MTVPKGQYYSLPLQDETRINNGTRQENHVATYFWILLNENGNSQTKGIRLRKHSNLGTRYRTA